ncbi:MAG TPA: DMT family transporter [Drouetiella sp.]
MRIIYFLLAIAAGCTSTLQFGINSQLKLLVGPLWTVAVSLTVSVIGTVLVLICARAPFPDKAVLASAPPWMWTGGICGIVFVLAGAVLAPKLGASTYTAALIAGQILFSVLLDHFGVLGFPKHAVNLERLIGIVLLAAGVLLVRRS